jgi:hypothetical protein
MFIVVAALGSSLGSNAYALAITDANVVGVIVDAVPFGDALRVVYVNNLLGLVAGELDPNNPTAHRADQYIGTERYIKDKNLGSGAVTYAGSYSGTGVSTISGYEYAFVKYDGPQGGAVVFYLNGASFALPSNDQNIFRNASGISSNCAPNCGISGWTAYNRVPDGGSTAALLGSVLFGMEMLRRRVRRS